MDHISSRHNPKGWLRKTCLTMGLTDCVLLVMLGLLSSIRYCPQTLFGFQNSLPTLASDMRGRHLQEKGQALSATSATSAMLRMVFFQYKLPLLIVHDLSPLGRQSQLQEHLAPPPSSSLLVPHQDAFYGEAEEHDVASLGSKVFFWTWVFRSCRAGKCLAKSLSTPSWKSHRIGHETLESDSSTWFFQDSQQLHFQPLRCSVLGLCYLSAQFWWGTSPNVLPQDHSLCAKTGKKINVVGLRTFFRFCAFSLSLIENDSVLPWFSLLVSVLGRGKAKNERPVTCHVVLGQSSSNLGDFDVFSWELGRITDRSGQKGRHLEQKWSNLGDFDGSSWVLKELVTDLVKHDQSYGFCFLF